MAPAQSNMTNLNRRRFITITAGAATAFATGALEARSTSTVQWNGVAMGADASLVLIHADRGISNQALKACIDEILRLEMTLSLYEPESDLSRLNRDGVLEHPSIDFVHCLSRAHAVSERSRGAFDVTVQPLFEYYRAHFAEHPNNAVGLDQCELAKIRSLVNFRNIRITAQEISFRRNGMAVTLNGIAQGYVCDRVTGLLRRFGFHSAMVNLGEIATLGNAPDGRPWSVGILNPVAREGAFLEKAHLSGRAMATSSPKGYMFDNAGRYHHLFDPRSGRVSNQYQSVTVAAPSATLADGLSTAMASMTRDEIKAVLTKTANLDVILLDAKGRHGYLNSKG
ncbi:MAG: FAD:protein FMN transferase [Rhodospirillaceae bacterium]|jgi:FAD:protein FMN transferase|nr:FAD:protein FMN transferase [Rhodospirillaceae bacterium]